MNNNTYFKPFDMIERNASAILIEKAAHYPIVAITGPRQSGKSTLAKATFPQKPYVSLEDLDTRQFATDDPRGFLSQFPNGAILDEVQHCPELFSYLQTLVDAQLEMGLFILTGSQQFALTARITQSLAGRVGFLQLLPFTLDEIQSANCGPTDLETLLFSGLYPPIYDRQVAPSSWYSDYIMTYVERDVRQLINVHDLHSFHRFLKMCAARTGQILNLSSLAADCGITHNTAKAWLSVLEASYIVFLLAPHYRSFNKRITKSPKLYFYDTGLVCTLIGIQESKQIVIHPIRGALFETWVVGELMKKRFNQGLLSNVYYWRDSQGHEIDIIVEQGEQLIPIEIKSGKTIASDFFDNLRYWQALANQMTSPAFLVYGGDQIQTRGNVRVIGWKTLSEISLWQNRQPRS
jgi:predicted AAA+ superfamily ATPase